MKRQYEEEKRREDWKLQAVGLIELSHLTTINLSLQANTIFNSVFDLLASSSVICSGNGKDLRMHAYVFNLISLPKSLHQSSPITLSITIRKIPRSSFLLHHRFLSTCSLQRSGHTAAQPLSFLLLFTGATTEKRGSIK